MKVPGRLEGTRFPRNKKRSSGPDPSAMKLFWPSKIGEGPVFPNRASIAANTPFRAALAKAHAFHIERSPTLVCRKATFATPAKLIACTVCAFESLRTLAVPRADENGP